MSELKPCPFCGSESGPEMVFSTFPTERYIFCENCTAQGNRKYHPDEAAEEWNHRPIEDGLRSELEASRAELAAERARLDFFIQTYQDSDGATTWLEVWPWGEPEIPAGQTARDVIDRLLKEAGDAG